VIARALFAVVLLAAAPASAQTTTTYQDGTAAAWGLAAFELGLVGAGASIAMLEETGDGDDADGFRVAYLDFILILLGTSATAIAAELGDAPSEGPLVWHGAVAGGFGLGLSAAGLVGLEDEDLAPIAGLVSGLLGMVAVGTYTAFRADDLAHDPEREAAAYLLSFGPPISALAIALPILVGSEGEAGVVAALASGIIALTLGALAIVLAETAQPPVDPTFPVIEI
jgi:hypothetical protein